MARTTPLLFSRESESDSWTSSKFSELMIEFAHPLLYVDPAGPTDINDLRTSMQLASLCWNAPMAEVKGDRSLMQHLEPMLKTAPAPIAAALRAMITARMTRFASVPFKIIAEVTGSSLDDARCQALTYADEHNPEPRTSIAPTGIEFFSLLFPNLAQREQEVWTIAPHEATASGLSAGSYTLRERYCADPGCDCQRVMIYVERGADRCIVATIGYGFDSPKPPYDAFERQIELDWLNPQSDQADAALARFTQQVTSDDALRTRLKRHYNLWKEVVDNRKHPLHVRLRKRRGQSAQPASETQATNGANATCACGQRSKVQTLLSTLTVGLRAASISAMCSHPCPHSLTTTPQRIKPLVRHNTACASCRSRKGRERCGRASALRGAQVVGCPQRALYASEKLERRDRRIVSGEIAVMHAEIGMVNGEIGEREC